MFRALFSFGGIVSVVADFDYLEVEADGFVNITSGEFRFPLLFLSMKPFLLLEKYQFQCQFEAFWHFTVKSKCFICRNENDYISCLVDSVKSAYFVPYIFSGALLLKDFPSFNTFQKHLLSLKKKKAHMGSIIEKQL